MDPTQQGTGVNWGQLGSNMASLFGTGANIYGGYQNMQNQNNLSGAANSSYMMAGGAYNPTLFGMNGVGGSGFSVSSPTNGGPGSINASLGSFSPMYSNYAGAAGQYNNASLNLANTASTGATGAYQSALASIMPQLQQMQGNLLSANNNALFQRGQLGSGSYGQIGAGGNPVNLTTQSLGAGFAQQDLNAIMAAQNQGLNFFNSNIAGAQGLGNLGFSATNAGMGMLGAQNQLAQTPLQYSALYGNQQIGATNAMSNAVRASNFQGSAPASGFSMFGSQFGGQGATGGINSLISAGQGAYNALTGASNAYNSYANGGLDAQQNADLNNWVSQGAFAPTTTGQFTNANGYEDLSGGPPSGAGGQAAAAGATGQAGGGMSAMQGLGTGLAAAGDVMGIKQGMQRGGVMGYGTAAVDAGKLANMAGAGIPGVGPAGAVLATYNAIKSYQSGKTGQDALQGAEAGAAWGSLVGPVGTVVGAVIGGAVGAVASAFGGGAPDQETVMQHGIDATTSKMGGVAQANAMASLGPEGQYKYLAGVMDAKNNSPGHSESIEQVFGRMGEGNLVNQMDTMLSKDEASGKIKPGESMQQQWSQVISPWLASKGATINPNQLDSKGNKEGQNIISSLEDLAGEYEAGQYKPSQLG